ncbi:MAG: UbiX family flavin prenyltransferase [Gemmatimonadetes bacterium]|jgi:flavin prenyltransferase|nr:UbiX family flavin prenyltransferase [Gemmatimonadota bacterium]
MSQVVVGVTGASGAIYAGRLLRALLIGGHTVHLVLSKYGRYLLVEELGFRPDKENLREFLARLYGQETEAGTLCEYGAGDLAAIIASGSVAIDAMAVVPCSVKTLSSIARGAAASLIERAADVSLKEQRPLVLVVRETPLNLIQLRNMTAAAEAGAILLPAMPAFYQKPQTFDDLGDFIAGRVCNMLRIEHQLFPPWEGAGTNK